MSSQTPYQTQTFNRRKVNTQRDHSQGQNRDYSQHAASKVNNKKALDSLSSLAVADVPSGVTASSNQLKNGETAEVAHFGRNLKTQQQTRNTGIAQTNNELRPNTRGAQISSTNAATGEASSRAPGTGQRKSFQDPTFQAFSNRDSVTPAKIQNASMKMQHSNSQEQQSSGNFQFQMASVLAGTNAHQTEFQKQSISERLEALRIMGYAQDKKIEEEAFWAADEQRNNEKAAREFHKKRVMSHQDKLRRMWDKNQSLKQNPEIQFYNPGPGAYETRDLISKNPTFKAAQFSKAQRPLNDIKQGFGIKNQIEEIEYHGDRKIIDKYRKVPEFQGYETSMGMNKSRISAVGRRLANQDDEKQNLFWQKPGFTWGMSTRTQPKDWDIVQVKLWPKCSYVPLNKTSGRNFSNVRRSVSFK